MEQNYICPNCKSILIIDNNSIGDIKCPSCNCLHNINSYTKVFVIEYQCKNNLCNRRWVVASRQNNVYSSHYVCPECHCTHIGQINHIIKTGKCPNYICGNNNLLFAIEPGKEPSHLTCPHCHQSNLFEEVIPQENKSSIKFRLELIRDRQEPNKGWYGGSRTIEFSLNEGEFKTIGRKSQNSPVNIQLETNDDRMSRSHIQVSIQNGPNHSTKLTITDKGSANGTYINSKRIPQNIEIPLNDNDTLRMGDSIFTFIKIVTPPKFEL